MAKQRKHYMKNKGGTYKNGQLISEQKGKTLTAVENTSKLRLLSDGRDQSQGEVYRWCNGRQMDL